MRVEVEWIDDLDGGLAELEVYLRQDPRLDDVPLERGRPIVPTKSLGVAEILEFVATDVTLGLLVQALYDFLRNRLRTRTGDKDVRLVLTRTDLDRARHVEIDYSGSADGAEQIVRAALKD